MNTNKKNLQSRQVHHLLNNSNGHRFGVFAPENDFLKIHNMYVDTVGDVIMNSRTAGGGNWPSFLQMRIVSSCWLQHGHVRYLEFDDISVGLIHLDDWVIEEGTSPPIDSIVRSNRRGLFICCVWIRQKLLIDVSKWPYHMLLQRSTETNYITSLPRKHNACCRSFFHYQAHLKTHTCFPCFCNIEPPN